MERFKRTKCECSRCPLNGRTRVYGEGTLANGIVFIGEGPGENEDSSGRPFVGRAGQRLDSGLYKAGIDRAESWLTNLVLCRPPNNDLDCIEGQLAKDCCRPGLIEELAWLIQGGLRVIVPLGNQPKGFFVPDAPGITKTRGSVYVYDDLPVMPTFHPSYLLHGNHYSKQDMPVSKSLIWWADLRKVRGIAEGGWQKPKENFTIYPSVAHVEDFVKEAKRKDALIAVDIETSGISADTAKVYMIGLAMDKENALCVPVYTDNFARYWTDDEWPRVKALVDDLLASNKQVYMNALFDVPILRHHGYTVPWRNVAHDVMVAHHRVCPELPHDLAFIVSLYGTTPYWKDMGSWKKTPIYKRDQEATRVYNCRDVVVLHQILPGLLADLREIGAEDVYLHEAIPLLKPVGKMMANGIGFSKTRIKHYEKETATEEERVRNQVYQDGQLPIRIITKTIQGKKTEVNVGFKLDSIDDLNWFLFRKPPKKFSYLGELPKKKPGTNIYEELRGIEDVKNTPPIYDCSRLPAFKNGSRSLDEESRMSLRNHLNNRLDGLRHRKRRTDEVLAEEAAIQRMISWLILYDDYKHLHKLVSTYFNYTPWADGRIHATFKVHGTATGRLSSSEPNLQNIPKRVDIIRKAFVAPPGKALLSADYSNLEVWVLAEEADDDILRAEAAENVHDANTKTLFGLTEDDPMWKVGRRAAKTFMFGGISYGGGPKEIHKKIITAVPELGLTYKRYLEAYTAWMDAHPAYKAWHDRVIEIAQEERISRVFNGHIRQLFGNPNDIAKQALNTPIQGGAGSIINRAMITIEEDIEAHALPMKTVLQVHDQLIYEVDKDAVDDMAKVVVNHMQAPVWFKDHEVSFPVDVEVGPDFGSLKEYTL